MRMRHDDDCAVALEWRPDGKRNRGRPKTTWKRAVEKERECVEWTNRGDVRHAAANRAGWKNDVEALCASWHGEN